MQAYFDGIRSCGQHLGQNFNSVTSCWDSLTQTTSAIADRVFGSITPVWDHVCNLAGQMTITEPAFERGAGFWSHPTDERSQSFLGALTKISSQRENWYSVSPYNRGVLVYCVECRIYLCWS